LLLIKVLSIGTLLLHNPYIAFDHEMCFVIKLQTHSVMEFLHI